MSIVVWKGSGTHHNKDTRKALVQLRVPACAGAFLAIAHEVVQLHQSLGATFPAMRLVHVRVAKLLTLRLSMIDVAVPLRRCGCSGQLGGA
jgi:hypothetical protein